MWANWNHVQTDQAGSSYRGWYCNSHHNHCKRHLAGIYLKVIYSSWPAAPAHNSLSPTRLQSVGVQFSYSTSSVHSTLPRKEPPVGLPGYSFVHSESVGLEPLLLRLQQIDKSPATVVEYRQPVCASLDGIWFNVRMPGLSRATRKLN